MVIVTRFGPTPSDALEHVLTEVLGEPPRDEPIQNGRVRKVLEKVGVTDINDLLAIDPMNCLLYTSPSPRDVEESRMPSSA